MNPETIERRLAQTEQARDELQARLTEAEARLRAQRFEIREATQAAERAQGWVQALLNSTSWRLTAPLRAIKALMARVLLRFGRENFQSAVPRPLSPRERELYRELRSAVPASEGSSPEFLRQVLELIAGRDRLDPRPAPGRPRLALVMPRQQATLRAARTASLLSRRYDVELIADRTEPDDGTTFGLPVHDWAWFEAHGRCFDRVLYEFRDDAEHAGMFALLRAHPGVALLRDFFLGHTADLGRLPAALFDSHGLTGVLGLANLGTQGALSSFPLNSGVVEHALGVIVHSESSSKLAADWYGPGAAAFCRHVPESMAPDALVDAIEHFSLHGDRARFRGLVEAVAGIAEKAHPCDRELVEAARALVAAGPGPSQRQLLVDVSAVARSDARTGIQRVVRSVLTGLVAASPAGWRVEPVYSTATSPGYRYARDFGLALVGTPGLELENETTDFAADDIFLGVDFAIVETVRNEAALRAMAARGTRIYFVVYDLLPLLNPEFFPPGSQRLQTTYLKTIASVADGLVGISRCVADDLTRWARQHVRGRHTPLRIGYFHLGSDIGASIPSFGLPADSGSVLEAMRARTSFLMVGTLEPRKGHAQALDAMELLWRRGVEANLVIAGAQGWMVEQFAARVRAHPELGRRLFWLSGVSDEMLQRLYAQASAFLATSQGEGFGLPLIEAARHGLPIVARDLPIFREVAGQHAYYFSAGSGDELAGALEAWLALHRAGQAPASAGMPRLDWSQSIQALLDVLEGRNWYAQV